jgi:hypothetical protein
MLKTAGMTLRAYADDLRDLPDPDRDLVKEGATFGTVNISCIRSSLHRTAVDRSWRPHKRFSSPTFLSGDEQIQPVRWVGVKTRLEPPTINEFLEQAKEIPRMTIAMAEIILTKFGCPGLTGELWQEHEDMSKS